MNIIVVHDEVSDDSTADARDAVSQAMAVREALEERGHAVRIISANLDLAALAARLRQCSPDLVFNLTESLGGHGRLIHAVPSLLEALRIPFTGVSAAAQFLTSNKLLGKRMMHAAYLPTPVSYELGDLEDRSADSCRFVPGRYIIKSVWEHASTGLDDDSVVTVESPMQAREAIERRQDRLGGEAFAEAFIEGREFNVALLSDADRVQVLPPAEIRFEGYRADQPRIVGYKAKWVEQSFEYKHTHRRYEFGEDDASCLERMESLALECWRLFQLAGYARVDFRVDDLGRTWILEVNTNPCLSPDAGFAAAMSRASIDYADGIDRILDAALRGVPVQSS